MNSLSAAYVELGRFAQAEATLREVVRRAPKGWSLLGEAWGWRALAYLGLGRLDEALSAGVRALDAARERQVPEGIGRAWRVLGRVAGRFRGEVHVYGQPCTAHGCYAASLQAFVEIGATGEQARTVRQWASYEMESGDRAEGQRLWQEARDLFTHLGMPYEVERMERSTPGG
jgi:tetratricopeptide (TPR) repeat protein